LAADLLIGEVAAVADEEEQLNLELGRALSHPLRLKILEALQGRVASPAELSSELAQRPSVVSYHATTLLQCGCLELVQSRPRRGGIENFFAITPRCSINRRD
jgi:DNA-binding transcriptional ArsR family regulator